MSRSRQRIVVVNDRMQQRYRHELTEPVGPRGLSLPGTASM